ncbi:hypothetical protein FJY71_01250 [candidate division WOR-3 bacterium]|nr:hypothetical protein [candidate division WOR-3 bacterium]
MPVVGWTDDEGLTWKFEDIAAGYGKFAAPRPVLLAMAATDSGRGYADVTASFIASRLWRQKLLQERHLLYPHWADSYFLWLGIAVHSAAEEAALRDARPGDVITERQMCYQHHAGPWVGGRVDLLIREGAGQSPFALWDYKTTGAYTGKMIVANGIVTERPEWQAQLSIYRWLARQATRSHKANGGGMVNQPLDVGPIKVCCLYRDWKPRDGVPPVQTFTVPYLGDAAVRELIDTAVADWLKLRDVPDDALPPCELDQLWLQGIENPRSPNCGKLLRCEEYCLVPHYCSQYQTALMMRNQKGLKGFTLELAQAAYCEVASWK